MNRKLKNSRFTLITFFTLCTVIILIMLGLWQLSRLKEKKLFLNSMHYNLTSPAINLDAIEDNSIYRKVKITGQFLVGKDIHLYGRRSISKEKDGYYLVTPFKTLDGKIILVARGWFSNRHKADISRAANEQMQLMLVSSFKNDEVHEIIGVTLPSEKARSFIPNNDIKNNVWFTMDLKDIANILELKLENFYIIQEGKDISNIDILLPLSMNHLANIRNDHLEYALTWFGLAISLIVIYFIYQRRNNGKNN